ncbi:MAG: alpha-ketoacid dehydrogenase subunit beta [Candidatus Rokubacteria bacterium]|nr:alpha-ketoacid dehydrogenase subunit beta [Candidatus Rokubacteria bacterium]
MRQITYREAIDEATRQAMAKDERIIVLGVGVDDAKGIFGTTRGAFEQFGSTRVFDTPLSEAALTGMCVGAGLRGLHPLLVHARNDFLLLTMDQIVNNAAKWRYMCGGTLRVPFTIRAVIGRGWGQAAQHSQSLQALFAHVPGLAVIMPATPADAKGLLMTALSMDSPVICLEHRWLYEKSGPVPEDPYSIPLGQAGLVREGSDVTIVAVSHMVLEAVQAAEALAADGIQAEILDVRSLRPLDSDSIARSVAKTGRLVIADTGWKSFGVSAEIAARIGEALFGRLKAPIRRVALPDVPTPASSAIEQIYYPGPREIAAAARRCLEATLPGERPEHPAPARPRDFHGPF